MTQRQHLPASRRKPNALVSSAKRVSMVRRNQPTVAGNARDWQARAWLAYTQTGEIHFTATYVGRGVSRAKLMAAHDPLGADEPAPLGADAVGLDRIAADLVADLGGSRAGQAQLLERMGVGLFVVGEIYVLGIELLDGKPVEPDALVRGAITWHALSSEEISSARVGDRLEVTLDGETFEVEAEDVVLVRVWNPHPQHAAEPDSPVRSVLRPVDELQKLEAHVAATVDSRLAGAGILVMPNSVTFAGGAAQTDTELEEDSDPFLVELVEVMSEALEDRDSASAVVPIVIRVPDEVVGSIQHLTFVEGLDPELRELRDEAIRRIALGLDLPAEILTGTGGSNAWSAWFQGDQAVRMTLEPLLATIADGLSTGYLRPALEAAGASPEEAARYSVWFDSSGLRPEINSAGEAQQLHDRGAISDEALRRAHGYGTDDAPEVTEVDEAVSRALDMAASAPSLLQTPGLPELVRQLREVLGSSSGGPAGDGPPDGPEDSSTAPVVDGQLPETAGEIGEAPDAEGLA